MSIMNQKEIAVSFLKAVGAGDVDRAFEKYVAPHFVHHNQYSKGDRQSLLDAIKESHKISANRVVDVKKSYEDKDTVITHSKIVREDSNAPQISVVHIFRFENELIAELWDVGQALIPDSPNENGVF